MILPILCNHLKYSLYYGVLWQRDVTKENRVMHEENNQRLLKAREELKNTMNKKEIVRKPNNSTDIIITIITLSRGNKDYNPYYLTQIVSKLLELLKNDATKLEFTYGLMVCNVDSLLDANIETKEISQFLHTAVKYPRGLSQTVNRFEKEKQDYVYCLETSLEFQPKYVLLMEDDAYPTDRMLPVLEYSIQNIFEGKYSEYFHLRRKSAYLKLYHPERLLGFISPEISRLFELASAILLLVTFIIALKKTHRCIHITWRLVILVGVFVLFFAFAIGRPNLIGFRTVSPYFHSFVTAPSCCTPANLYSYDGARAVIDSISHKDSFAGHAKDALLDEFLKESGYNAIYVEPNVFKHIGQYSSLRQGKVLDPYVV